VHDVAGLLAIAAVAPAGQRRTLHP
jgi:hypothetical protein